MSFLKNPFGKGKQESGQSPANPYSIASLNLPRQGTSLDERISNQQKDIAPSSGIGSAGAIVNWQDFVRGKPPLSPILLALNGRAHAIARLDKMPRSEADQLGEALRQGLVVFSPRFAACPTMVIFGPVFSIYDSPQDPFHMEDPRDIRLADVQEFISAILQHGEGELHLYYGSDAVHIASGRFALCMPSPTIKLPYTATDTDRNRFWQAFTRAANDLKTYPKERLDYETAVKFYFQNTTL